eukprot:3558193-Prymnesium_polylepis.1
MVIEIEGSPMGAFPKKGFTYWDFESGDECAHCPVCAPKHPYPVLYGCNHHYASDNQYERWRQSIKPVNCQPKTRTISSRAVLKAKMSRIAAVGELQYSVIWSELMGDEQMYGVWGMFELLSSYFRANLRDLGCQSEGIQKQAACY